MKGQGVFPLAPFMRFNTRLWSAGRLFAIAACLIATYLLFAVTAMQVALRVREVPVPDLRNHTVAEATAQAQDAGLALAVDESGRLDPKIAAGRIAVQEPAAGTITRRQRTIRVWVRDRKSTRLNSSHSQISYAVFCLKKKKKKKKYRRDNSKHVP